MIFVIPIILGAAALASAAIGVGAGADGISNIKEAKERGKEAENKHKRAIYDLEREWDYTQIVAKNYGLLQLIVKQETISRFVTFIKTNGISASQKDLKFLEGLEGVSIQQIEAYEAEVIEAEKLAGGTIKAIGAAGAAGQSAIGMAALFGTASTGTAIGGLSGAAAWNATLAWLGGGSLAAGGGGMALGTMVLGGIAVGPALAIGGFALASQGEKALTEVTEYESKVNVDIEKIKASQDFLIQVKRRTIELYDLVSKLNDRALVSLQKLESQPFDRQRDAVKFQETGLFIKALSEIMKQPVLDYKGKLNPVTKNIKAKYRYLEAK